MFIENEMTKKREVKGLIYDFLALFIITLVIIWRFWPVITRHFTFVDFSNDVAEFSYPFMVSAARALNHGELPLWMHELQAGQTLFGFPQLGVLYPLYWLVWFFGYRSDHISFLIVDSAIIMHIIIAAFGAYFLARVLKMNRFVSSVVSFFYFLSPSFLSYSYWIVAFTGFSWFPVLIGLIILALRYTDHRAYLYVSLGGGGRIMCINSAWDFTYNGVVCYFFILFM
jgi:hypothetical protein